MHRTSQFAVAAGLCLAAATAAAYEPQTHARGGAPP
jgi:hypothetical protein